VLGALAGVEAAVRWRESDLAALLAALLLAALALGMSAALLASDRAARVERRQ
jgi:hypothetical protein